MYIKEQSKSNTHGKQVNQPVNQSWSQVCGAPTKARFILAWIGLTNSIVLELWEKKKHSCLLKSREIEDYLKTKV